MCYILNDREPRGKFDAKSDEGVFLGYCKNNRAYRAYNKRTKVVIESINVKVDDYLPPSETSRLEDPPVVLVLEKEKTLNNIKEAPPSSDEENERFSVDVQAIPEARHLISTDARVTEDSLHQ